MSIWVDSSTRVVIQGLTGSQGRFHGLRNRDSGTRVVAGVTPGRAGEDVDGIPVFGDVASAVAETGADASVVFVPARSAPEAVLEAAAAGIGVVVCITEGIPAHDALRMVRRLEQDHPDTRLIGPNCPGIISPGRANLGIIPTEISRRGGGVGVVSRSGTLTYQGLQELSRRQIGQTTCVGIGGDPFPGTTFVDCLRAFEADPETEAVILIGEIGGTDEELAAEVLDRELTKPVVAYVAGVTAPKGRRMGHAGAIVSSTGGDAEHKIAALRAAGATVVDTPTDLGSAMAAVLGDRDREDPGPRRS